MHEPLLSPPSLCTGIPPLFERVKPHHDTPPSEDFNNIYTPPKVLSYVFVLVSFVYLKDIYNKSYVFVNYKIIALIQHGFDLVDLVQDKI